MEGMEDVKIAIQILQYAHNYLLIGKTHGQEIMPDVQYWQQVHAIILNPKNALMQHKFGFARDYEGKQIPGFIKIIGFIGVEKHEIGSPIKDKYFIATCYGVDEILGMYAYFARVNPIDVQKCRATLGCMINFRRGFLGVTKTGKQVGARVFGGRRIYNT